MAVYKPHHFSGSGTRLAVSYFSICMFFTYINCVQPVSSNFFTAIGKPKKGIFLSLTRQIIFLLPFVLILPLLTGINGIMFADPIADFIAAALSFVMVFAEFRSMDRYLLQDRTA